MRMLRNGFLAAASSVLLAGAAHAVPLDSTAIPPSNFNLEITSPALGSGSGSGAITGTASTDITITSTNVSTVGGSGTFAVGTFSIPFLGTTTLAGFGFTVALPATISTSGTNPFTPDLASSVITVDQGFVENGGSTLFDFSKTPTVVTAPSGLLTTLDVVAGTWTIPFTSTSTLTTLSLPVNIIIGTDLVLQAVPEPGTLLLLGAGVAGLATARRKRA